MADVRLDAQVRTLTGHKAGRLRRQGIIPANIYGGGLEQSIPVQFDVRSLREVLLAAGTTTVVDVHVRTGEGSEDGGSHPVLIESITRHPSTGQVLHVDLHQVNLNKPVRAHIPITLTGEAPAEKLGHIVFHPLDSIEVEALPRALPHGIEVDVSHLENVDEQITVADLRLPAGVTIDTDPETLVVRVMASTLEAEVEAEEAEAAEAAAEAAAEVAEAEAPAEGEAAAGEEETSAGPAEE